MDSGRPELIARTFFPYPDRNYQRIHGHAATDFPGQTWRELPRSAISCSRQPLVCDNVVGITTSGPDRTRT